MPVASSVKPNVRLPLPALNTGAYPGLVVTVSFFRDDDIDGLDLPHLLGLCFYLRLLGLVWVILSAVIGSLSLARLLSATCYLRLLSWVLRH